jgi:hypothetical protein
MMEARPGADKENKSHEINGNTSSRARSSRKPKHAQSPGSTSSESDFGTTLQAAAWDGDVRLVTIGARRLLEWSVGHPPVAVVEVYEKYSGGSWKYVCSTVCLKLKQI